MPIRSRPDPRRAGWLALTLLATPLAAQQVSDTAFHPAIAHPAFAPGTGPVVGIDEAHHNFHTLAGRYAPFAALLARDGYRLVASTALFDSASLARLNLLVVANAVAAANETSWAAPILPAFTPAEVDAVQAWVERGGALLLIADHMPFGGAAAALGEAFGFRLGNGFAVDAAGNGLPAFTRAAGTLGNHAVTRGPAGPVDHVMTFMGEAFPLPPGATALLTLPPGSRQYLPDTAWVFHPTTPVEPAGGMAQGAVQSVGRGRVAVFGEAAMFSAQVAGPNRVPAGMNAPGAEQNAILLRNLVRWLTAGG